MSPPFFFPPIMVPTYLEQLIHQGRAEFKSYSGFASENHIIKVPESTYIIIYEYWYKPQFQNENGLDTEGSLDLDFSNLVQYVHFFTGNKYHPFFHKLSPISTTGTLLGTLGPATGATTVNYMAIGTDYRTCYIGSSKDVSVYFTRLTKQSTVYTPTTIPPINSFQSVLGYASEAIAGRITRFNRVSATHYGPLQQPYSQIGGLTSIDFNQAFTTPGGGANGGNIHPPESVYGAESQKQARQLFFHCNYIQVNEPAPKTLI